MLPESFLHRNQPLHCALYHAGLYTDVGDIDEIAPPDFGLSPHPAQTWIQVKKTKQIFFHTPFNCHPRRPEPTSGATFWGGSFCFGGYTLRLNSFSDLSFNCCLIKKQNKTTTRLLDLYISAPSCIFPSCSLSEMWYFVLFGHFCGEIHHMWLFKKNSDHFYIKVWETVVFRMYRCQHQLAVFSFLPVSWQSVNKAEKKVPLC